jgi:hypothetical protein
MKTGRVEQVFLAFNILVLGSTPPYFASSFAKAMDDKKASKGRQRTIDS